MLTQPAVAVTIGWFVFGEALAPLDFAGMALVGAALVLARLPDQAAFRGTRAASTGGQTVGSNRNHLNRGSES